MSKKLAESVVEFEKFVGRRLTSKLLTEAVDEKFDYVNDPDIGNGTASQEVRADQVKKPVRLAGAKITEAPGGEPVWGIDDYKRAGLINNSLDFGESNLFDFRQVAYDYHGGQNSALYSFASTDLDIHGIDHAESLLVEIEHAIEIAAAKEQTGNLHEPAPGEQVDQNDEHPDELITLEAMKEFVERVIVAMRAASHGQQNEGLADTWSAIKQGFGQFWNGNQEDADAEYREKVAAVMRQHRVDMPTARKIVDRQMQQTTAGSPQGRLPEQTGGKATFGTHKKPSHQRWNRG